MDLRELRRRTLIFVLAYLLALAPWPLLRHVYAPLFRAGAEFALGVIDPFHGEVRVLFDPAIENDPVAKDMPGMDTRVRLQHRSYSGEGLAGASSFFHAYHPTAVLLALFVATPLSWRVLRWRFLWAALLLHAFIALRCVIGAYTVFASSAIGGAPAVALNHFQERVLHWTWHFAWEEPVATYLVPLLCWGLCVYGARSRTTSAETSSRSPSFPATTSS
jgi:hypothetical protein